MLHTRLRILQRASEGHSASGSLRLSANDAYMLEHPIYAWNVRGSSTHKPESSSWIREWEEKTGLSREVCSCAYDGCTCTNVVGGHIWLKGLGPHIAPICQRCNNVQNYTRTRATDGHHSLIKAGTAVFKTEYTKGMKAAVGLMNIRGKPQRIEEEFQLLHLRFGIFTMHTLFGTPQPQTD